MKPLLISKTIYEGKFNGLNLAQLENVLNTIYIRGSELGFDKRQLTFKIETFTDHSGCTDITTKVCGKDMKHRRKFWFV